MQIQCTKNLNPERSELGTTLRQPNCSIGGGTQRRFPQCIENTFQAIQNTFRSLQIHYKRRFKICICTFRSLEIHYKRRYKICICSVVLGQLESFRNYKGLRTIFPKILDVILSFTKVRIFLIPPSIACLNPKILGFLFLPQKKANLGTDMRKIIIQKILRNLLDMLRKLYMNGTVIQNFLAFPKLQ